MATGDAPLSVPPVPSTHHTPPFHSHSWCCPRLPKTSDPILPSQEAENSGEAGKPQAPDLDLPTTPPSPKTTGI